MGNLRKTYGCFNWQKLKKLFSYLCTWIAPRISRFKDSTKDCLMAAMNLKISIYHWTIHMNQTKDP